MLTQIHTSPAGLGNLNLLPLTPFMDGYDSARTAVWRIKSMHLTSTYGRIVLSPSVDVEQLIMVGNVVNVDDTHFDVLKVVRYIVSCGDRADLGAKCL